MSKHTPEPWFFEGQETPFITSSEIGLTGICDLYHLTEDKKVFVKADAEANGLRIVACVNACAGMEDPEKEIAALKKDERDFLQIIDERDSHEECINKICSIIGVEFEWSLQCGHIEIQHLVKDRIEKLRAENQVLRDALEGMILSADPVWEEQKEGHDWDMSIQVAREALAKVREKEEGCN